MKIWIACTCVVIGCHFDSGRPGGGGGGGGGGGEPAGSDAAIGDVDATVEPPMFDPNGVAQIYPTRAGKAEPWTLGFGAWQLRARSFGTTDGDAEQTIVTASGQVRMTVKAEDSDCEGNTDHGEALAQGHMCSPNDWLAFEMTAYMQLVEAADANGDRDWTFYGGGGRHTGNGAGEGCLGSAYKGSYHYVNADVRMRKESFHVNYSDRSWKPVTGGIDFTAERDRWLGIKFIRYDFMRDGKRGMRMEQWLDLGGVDAAGAPANQWTLVNVEEDHPDAASWGEQATACGAPADDQIMFWGGPWVTFRWDNTTARARLMSVREIVPPAAPPAP